MMRKNFCMNLRFDYDAYEYGRAYDFFNCFNIDQVNRRPLIKKNVSTAITPDSTNIL